MRRLAVNIDQSPCTSPCEVGTGGRYNRETLDRRLAEEGSNGTAASRTITPPCSCRCGTACPLFGAGARPGRTAVLAAAGVCLLLVYFGAARDAVHTGERQRPAQRAFDVDVRAGVTLDQLVAPHVNLLYYEDADTTPDRGSGAPDAPLRQQAGALSKLTQLQKPGRR